VVLSDFLRSKPLYYKEIDHKRIYIAYEKVKSYIRHPRTVHVVGTNGKGSTGRVVAYLAYKSGLSVGHYSSPHILNFNERLWLNNKFCTTEALEEAHQKLYSLVTQEIAEGLSYFEYTTLLAFILFESCDLMVLEAGLGGEFDATNVCSKVLSIITPIGYDHQTFLGEHIEEIAGTKLRSIEHEAIIAPQLYDEVYRVAEQIAEEKGATLHVMKEGTSHSAYQQVDTIAKKEGWAGYLIDNALVACEALQRLHIPYSVDDLVTLQLFGRYYPIEPHIHIDVGHNPLAATALVDVLKEETILIYNTLEDKAYQEVLRILQPKIKEVQLLPIADTPRALKSAQLKEALKVLGIPYSDFEEINAHEHYLVFGSFYVVEAFLNYKGYTTIDVTK
jgi:dihydrofolate synthase/folylpolyglutamate synthase